ncbi:MAG: GIY-YIG nuclease family protein [Bradyrhizobium sp.]
MKSEDKKAAIAAYKERKTVAGIYVIRCSTSGQVWVGQSPNLDTIQNRIWFSLRMGSNSNRELQNAWTAHGGNDFTFEAIERLKDEELAYVRDTLLKERAAHWRSVLNGSVV